MPSSKKINKPLTDAQLAAKYDTGKPAEFEQAVKKMAKTPSTTAKNKGR